jgi:hypothetical protein
MNDKRKQPRINVAWILRLAHRQGGHIQSRTVNVSGSGILFVSPQFYSKDEIVEIEMDISTGCTLRAIIRIARELPGGGRIRTYGAQFLRFAEDDYERLKETLEMILQRQSGGGSMLPEESPQPTLTPVSAPKPAPSRLVDRRWGPRAEDSPDAAQRRYYRIIHEADAAIGLFTNPTRVSRRRSMIGLLTSN